MAENQESKARSSMKILESSILKENDGGDKVRSLFERYVPKEWVLSNGLSVMIFLDGIDSFMGDFIDIFNHEYNENFYVIPEVFDFKTVPLVPFGFDDIDSFGESRYENCHLFYNNFIVFNEALNTLFHVSDEMCMMAFGPLEKLEKIFEMNLAENKKEYYEFAPNADVNPEASYYWGESYFEEIGS